MSNQKPIKPYDHIDNPSAEVDIARPSDDAPDYRKPPHPIQSAMLIIRNIILILIGSYGLSQSIHIILNSMVGERSTVVAFFNTFAHFLWIPALILLPLMLIFRQRRIAVTLILPALMFTLNYGVLFLPRSPLTLATDAQRLTIHTHNVLARNRTLERIPDIITDISADIVALQEISTDLEPMLLTLDDYPYKAIHAVANDPEQNLRNTMGQAILSRYPILEDDYWTYDFLTLPLGHQRVVIDVDGQPVVIYNIHPTHPGMTGYAFFDPDQRSREIADLIQRIQSETYPVLMIGDFNLTDLSDDYSQVASILTDTHYTVGRGMGFTFPDFQESYLVDSVDFLPDTLPDHLPTPPLMRLDYVFHSEQFRGISTRVYHSSGGSDHRPLIVELVLKPD